MIYKVITKVLCKRLKNILPQIISKDEGAFVETRSISENILICQELVKQYER